MPHQKNELQRGFREIMGNIEVWKWGNGPQVGAMPQQRPNKMLFTMLRDGLG